MSYQPFYITQYEQDTGQENYFQSFLLPEKAFPKIQDAYCWRGQVKRRQGFFELGRLQREAFTLAAPYSAFITLSVTATGLTFSNADILSDANVKLRNATPVPETYAEITPKTLIVQCGGNTYNDVGGVGTLTATVGTGSGTINYVTGALALTFTAGVGPGAAVVVSFQYYPALPCMGLRSYKLPVYDFDFLVAFDQKYAYEWDNINNVFIQLLATGPVQWSGTDSQLFWTFNYQDTLQAPQFWVTNANVSPTSTSDAIRIYTRNLSNALLSTWIDFAPYIDAFGDQLLGCQCILSFKDRILCFNTWETVASPNPSPPPAYLYTTLNFPARVRWSWIGDPTNQANGWQTTPGAGGYLDCYTDEHITSVAYLKDVIIVKFEWSSYKLVYTGNETQPFVFQKINDDFGSTSSFSLIDFDDGIYAVGDNAITTDDTTSVERLDIKIPDQVYNIQPSSNRTYGIRDFTNELVYWAYTDITYHPVWPNTPPYFNNQVLVYNYRNNSWAHFTDFWTCYGTFELEEIPLSFPPILPNTPQIVAGNQQGFVEMLNTQVLNSPSLAIYAIAPGSPVGLTVANHTFNTAIVDFWIRIDGIIGQGPNDPSQLNYSAHQKIYHLTNATDANTFYLQTWDPFANAFHPVTLLAGGTYLGGGVITVIQNFNILTKDFSPFYEQGHQNLVPYIDFLTDTTANGQYTCNIYLNESPISFNDSTFTSNKGLLGSNLVLTQPENIALYPMQQNQAKIWHRFFAPYISQNFQLQLTMSNSQMSSQLINDNDFVLHAMTLYLSPNARMTQ